MSEPPPSQGFALLAALRAVERAAPAPLASWNAEAAHLLICAADAALDLRDRLNHDGAVNAPLAALDAVETFPARFDPHTFRPARGSREDGRKGDTAHLAVVDRDGLAVSLIQSVFRDFGSCIPVPEAGYVLQNRGAAFSLDPHSPATEGHS